MDPVDVLSFAVTAAKYIRSAADPDAVLAQAFRRVGVESPAPGPLAVRLAALMDAAGEEGRRDVLDFLNSQSGPLPLNRPMADPDAELDEPDPEAVRLADYASENEEAGRPMFGDQAFGAFDIATRSATAYYEDEPPGKKGGRRKKPPEPPPVAVRCVLDYPMEVPVLFTIETGAQPWSVWDICCAIADQYARLYEQASRYGVWGHDIDDLVIEELLYFPEERLIYPHIGS